MATASSKFVKFTLLMVIFEPYGSIPSVLRGIVGIESTVFEPTKVLYRLSRDEVKRRSVIDGASV